MIEITRFNDVVTITASNTATTTSGRMAFSSYVSGAVLIGNTNGCTKIDWYGAHGSETTPLQIYSSGAAVTSAVTVGAIVMPAACEPFPFVVPVVSGGTTCAMTVVMKG